MTADQTVPVFVARASGPALGAPGRNELDYSGLATQIEHDGTQLAHPGGAALPMATDTSSALARPGIGSAGT